MKSRQPQGNEDSNKTRCRRCGFLGVDKKRDKSGPGSGLRYEAIPHTATFVRYDIATNAWVTASSAPDDPIRIAGCGFCGTKNYENWAR